eukprot:3135536-Prymnesium_polylepis.1
MDPGRGSADGEARTNRRAFIARSTSHAEDVVYCGWWMALSGAGALERASAGPVGLVPIIMHVSLSEPVRV